MANETDNKILWTILDLYRGLGLSASFNGNKSVGELLVLFASLTYLRQHDSLFVKPEKEVLDSELLICSENGICVCCAANIAEETYNEEFIELLKLTLAQFRFADKKQIIIELADVLNDIELDGKGWLKLFDDFLLSLPGRSRGEFTQPHELSELVNFLLDSQARHFFDPFGGVMDFATTIIKGVDYRYTANEINASVRDVAMFRLALGGVLNQCRINHRQSENWIGKDERFDAIITTPPFGMRMQMREGNEMVNETAELVAIKRFEDTTNQTGQLITIVPVSFLYGETAKPRLLREKLTKKNLLDCVIQLPGGIFPHTGLATAVVVLKKQRAEGQRIKLIDASSCFVKDGQRNVLDIEAVKRLYKEGRLEVTTEELLNQNCSWDVQWYWNRMNAVFNQGYTIVKLSDVLEPIRPIRHYSETMGRFVSISSLSPDCFSYEKNPEDFPEKERMTNAYKLTEPALLVSTVGTPKPTYCKASGDLPVFVKNDVCAFRVTNKTIHEGYLCMELAKRLIPTMGSLYSRLSRTQILETYVEFPSLNGDRSWIEQKNIFEEARLAAGIGKEREEWLEALIEKKKREYIEEVRHRKHDMKTPMSQLRNTLTLLESLVPQISGEPAEKLMLYVQRQKRAMDRLSEIVTHIADEDVFATSEPVDLSEVLSSFQTKTDRYIIQYFPDKALLDDSGLANPMVNMGRSDLLRLVQNIIENAIRHGFVGKNSEYALNISLTIREGYYVVDFSNNGKPLPEGLDKVRYGMKGERGKDSDGSGTGGYIVKSITEHYGGDYDVFSEQFAGIWFTHVIVKLPIYQDNE